MTSESLGSSSLNSLVDLSTGSVVLPDVPRDRRSRCDTGRPVQRCPLVAAERHHVVGHVGRVHIPRRDAGATTATSGRRGGGGRRVVGGRGRGRIVRRRGRRRVLRRGRGG